VAMAPRCKRDDREVYTGSSPVSPTKYKIEVTIVKAISFQVDPARLITWVIILHMGFQGFIDWNVILVLFLLEIKCPITLEIGKDR
jgi:hypothetical protein